MSKETALAAIPWQSRIGDTNPYELLQYLPDSVAFHLALRARERLRTLLLDIKNCESPIEQLLAVAIRDMAEDRGWSRSNLIIETQFEIPTTNFRVDFHVTLTLDNQEYVLLIECDGHDYHERTKEQAARDKKRDRSLQKLGYTIIHFTGSEIVKDSFGCGKEVCDVLTSMCRKEGAN